MLAAVPAGAWWDSGHMAVAYIAYTKLTARARARVDALVRLNPSVGQWEQAIPAGTPASKRSMILFMYAATWPDQIKEDSTYYADGPDGGNTPPADSSAYRNVGYSDHAMHKYWHFVDLPFSPDGTPLDPVPTPNARTQIAAFRAVLASDSSDSLKSYDLVWLLHLVGDIHQPLHCVTRFTSALPQGDAGGNFVKLNGGSNLHKFWDSQAGDGDNPLTIISWANNLSPAPAAAAANLDAKAWASESFSAAKAKAYAAPIKTGAGPYTLTAAYRNAALAVAKKRIALAGARLARILNRELK